MKFFSSIWRNPFARTYSKQEITVFRLLRKNSLFSALQDDELIDFVPHLYSRSYGKGEVVFFRNDPSQALYLLKEGRIAISLDIEDRFEKLITLKPYQSFGENTLLEHSLREYHAISMSDDTEVYVIPQINIFEIFEDNIQIKAKMMTCLATQYNQHVTSLFTNYRNSIGFIDLADAYYQLITK